MQKSVFTLRTKRTRLYQFSNNPDVKTPYSGLTESSELSPCGHLALTDTIKIRTAAKSQAKLNSRRLIDINS